MVVVAGLIKAGAVAAIPIPVVLAAGWIYAAERCGLVVTKAGIQSRMTRQENSTARPWTQIESFELVDKGAQVAIVMRLCDGSSKLLPSTRAWFWDKSKVNLILADLLRELGAQRAHLTR